jgi:hypothetical protein
MTFKENFIAVVKVGGRIMRELTAGTVALPFGSEYSLLLKNKESRKAIVGVEIDGKDVLNGRELIINPNSEMELKGFMDGMTAKNAFKFIQKTQEIVDNRGDKVDDGIIRVSFRFEKQVTERTVFHETHITRYHDYYPWDHWYYPRRWSYYPVTYSNYSLGSASGCPTTKGVLMSCSVTPLNSAPLQDEGITVKGSEVNQGFVNGYTAELENNTHVIILRLCGSNSVGAPITTPITVNTVLKCETCGKESKSSAKFCDRCGTALI